MENDCKMGDGMKIISGKSLQDWNFDYLWLNQNRE